MDKIKIRRLQMDCPLKHIKYDKELSEFDLSMTAPCDDRLMTKVTLDDYDWMDYKFETYFPTKTQGLLHMTLNYVGFVTSYMTVEQKINDKTVTHTLEFDSDIFIEFIKDFLTKHIAAWDETYAFCGEKEAVEIYNKILDNHTDYKVEQST